MTWKGSSITQNGFIQIFQGFNVSNPELTRLGFWECNVGETKVQAKTLTELSQLTIKTLINFYTSQHCQ